MAIDTTVKFFHSAMTGAPTLTGQPGQMVALLDALLVNGYGLGNADSITVSGGVATVIRSLGHPFDRDTVVNFAGATGSYLGLNGDRKVINKVSPTTYTCDATGLPDGTVTGTVAHKMAPCGFSKIFAATNKGAYKSADVASTGAVLRVDDTTGNESRVSLYESMSDVDTGLPSGGGYSNYWPKSQSNDATQRAWALVGDSRLFYLFVQNYPNTGLSSVSVFGDFISAKSPDAFATVLNAGPSGAYGSSENGMSYYDFASIASAPSWGVSSVVLRSFTGIGPAVVVNRNAAVANAVNSASFMNSGSDNSYNGVYPNPVDYALYLSEISLNELLISGVARRGVVPGHYYVPQRCGASAFGHLSEVTGVAALPGRHLRAIQTRSGVSFVDVTGPWR